jgi:hypothetical protein
VFSRLYYKIKREPIQSRTTELIILINFELNVLATWLPLADSLSLGIDSPSENSFSILEKLQISFDIAYIQTSNYRLLMIRIDPKIEPRLMSVSIAIILEINVIIERGNFGNIL